MPKFRQLHTQIVNSFDFAEMPNDFTRVLWLMLMVIVDGEGRGIDNPAWVRSMAFPLREDVSLEQVDSSMDWLDNRGMINRYQVGSRDYFEVVTFKTYQSGLDKEAPSKLPANPAQVIKDAELLESYSRVTPELVPSKSASTSTSTSTSTAITNTTEEEEAKNPEFRPAIFRLYEREIGALTPMIADALKAAEQEYPPEWITVAFSEAAARNARSWAYVEAILKRWKKDGFKADSRPPKNGKPPGQPVSKAAQAAAALRQRYGVTDDTSDITF